MEIEVSCTSPNEGAEITRKNGWNKRQRWAIPPREVRNTKRQRRERNIEWHKRVSADSYGQLATQTTLWHSAVSKKEVIGKAAMTTGR